MGNQWTITVHGPGQVIVTDTTPNDGSLDDEINTIQIIGSNPRTTYVTGTTVASNTVLSSGTVNFNRLIALNGVKSIALNGFNLSHDVTPAVAQAAGIFLYGGVGTLRFNDILALIDTTGTNVTNPYQIVIGDPSTPLTVKPSIYLDSIYNSVFDGSVAPTTANAVPVGPLTTPSVIFSINGVVQNFSVVSVTQSAAPPNYVTGSQGGTVSGWTDPGTPGVPLSGPVPAGFQFFYNVVGTTGRTSLQAQAINHLNVKGKSTNLTAQRDLTPFTSSLSGLKYLHSAKFGGNADGVALDVNGPIGKVEFKRGLGDPSGTFTGTSAIPNPSPNLPQRFQLIPATNYGVPQGSTGYPAAGLLGGVVAAKSIGKVKVGPANYITQTSQNPNFVQVQRLRFPTYYMVNPGTAVTNSAITTSGSIGSVSVKGSQLNSEIKTGFDYASHVAGLEGTRGASRIGRLRQQGDLVNSVISASFRPAKNSAGNFVYSYTTGTAGDGSITGTTTGATSSGIYAGKNARGRFPGGAFNTNGRTALGNFGAGVFARTRSKNLPPPRA